MATAKSQLLYKKASYPQSIQACPRPTILIAEDSADSREMMSILLRLKGYDVLSAADGVEALEMAFESFPDLIFIDLQLPKLDGLNVARNLRRHPRLRTVPIFVLSGHDPARYRQTALDAGCTGYFLKPLDFQTLDELLDKSLPLN